MSFADLSSRAQVWRLRRTALEALRHYPLKVARLKLLNHGFNTSFAVQTTDGRKFALRLGINSPRSLAQTRAELAWLGALSRDTDVRVPQPQATRDDELLLEVYSPDLERHLTAVLFSWLPGPNLGERASLEQMREVGKVMAVLHRHARTWELPAGTSLKTIDGPLMGDTNHLESASEHLPPQRLEVVHQALKRVTAALGDLFAREQPRVLHTDLHNWNVKWARGKLYVFDFDDCALGLPVQDLAIAAYYLRDASQLEAALLEGYARVAPLPAFTRAEYEAIVAGRALVLLNDVLVNQNASIRGLISRFAPNTELKLRHYLETGVFKHQLPGLIPPPRASTD